jgi:hypothetical protein
MARRFDPVLLGLLALSLSGNVYLYRYSPSTRPRVSEALKPGDAVPPLTGKTVSGDDTTVDFAHKAVVMYMFSPSCSWCERNLDNARFLADHAGAQYDFVGVALDDTDLAQYLADRRLTWRVVRRVPRDLQGRYRLSGTPTTLMVGQGGRVLHTWTGAYSGQVASEIQDAFHLTLPGLRALPTTKPNS